MDIYILLLIIFVVLSTLSKLSFMKVKYTFIWSGLMALFVLVVAPWAAESTKPGFEALLQSPVIRGNVAALVTVEAALCCSYVFMALNSGRAQTLPGRARSRRWLRHLLYGYPTLMIFPILYYLLARLFFAFPGVDFSTLSWSLAALVFLAIPLVAFLYDRALNDREFKLEIQLVLSLSVALLGLVSTATTQVVYAAPDTEVISDGPPSALLLPALLLFAFACMAIGAFIHKFKNNNRHSL